MNKKTKIIMIILTLLILLTSISFLLLKNRDVDNITSDSNVDATGSLPKKESQSSETVTTNVKENKYYVVYIKLDDGTGSSFVPLKLNPGFTNDTDFRVSISIDDNGNVINGEKIIVIENFFISNENKEKIKEIVGEETYKEALREIEDRVLETKENFEKEGIL